MRWLTEWVDPGRGVHTTSMAGRALRARHEGLKPLELCRSGRRVAARNGVRALPLGVVASLLVLCTLLPGGLAPAAEQPLLKLRAVPFKDVIIQDCFWAPRRETNRLASIPFSLQKLEDAGNIEDMRLAARRATKGFRGPVFMDSDLYKAL